MRRARGRQEPVSGTASLRMQLARRAPRWRDAAARLARLERREPMEVEAAADLLDDYRRVAADLAAARRLDPSSRTREELEALYARLHGELHRAAVRPWHRLRVLLRDELPEAMSHLRWHLGFATLLFTVTALAAAWLIGRNPALARLFASNEMITTVERGKLWTEGLFYVVPGSVLSVQILTNNIVVNLMAYCAGFLFGLGTFYVVGLNGLMLGGVFAFTAANGLGGKLFEFVVAHGVVEIACLCLSGAAGAAVGESLVRPGAATRRDAFARAARDTLPVMAAVVLLLVGCGFIEGYVSPNPDVPLTARLVIGFGYLAFMVALLQGWVFGRSRGGRLAD